MFVWLYHANIIEKYWTITYGFSHLFLAAVFSTTQTPSVSSCPPSCDVVFSARGSAKLALQWTWNIMNHEPSWKLMKVHEHSLEHLWRMQLFPYLNLNVCQSRRWCKCSDTEGPFHGWPFAASLCLLLHQLDHSQDELRPGGSCDKSTYFYLFFVLFFFFFNEFNQWCSFCWKKHGNM